MTLPVTRVGAATILIAGVGLIAACRGRLEGVGPSPTGCTDNCDAGPTGDEPTIDAGPALAAQLLIV